MRNILWLLILTSPYVLAQDDKIFQIGFPDGKAAEFRSPIKWENYFDQKDPIVCRYVVGQSRPRDWFPWWNSTRDWKAAGRSFSAIIEFDAAKDYTVPLYFVFATCYGHPTEPSLLHMKVNGTDVEPVRVPNGPPGFPKWNSSEQFGWPGQCILTIPAGLVKEGHNELHLTLKDGSWCSPDYIVLREKNEPLPIVKTDDMLKNFRAAGGPMEDVREVLFAVRKPSYDGHWYANFGYYACDTCTYPFPLGSGGSLRILNLDTGKVRTIFEDKEGNVRDPQIHYDGKKAIFSYLKKGTRHYNLYEINLDGTGLRQITSGNWDDVEPTYLPNGDIVFASTRAKCWVQCWLTGVATLHRCGPNGENIYRISSSPEQENTPWVLPNGQIIYMRWEYIDRSQVHYHHLWTTNPDGTKHAAYYGNQTPGICMLGAKPVRYRADAKPEDKKYPVVCTFSPGHGRKEHYGMVTLVTPELGPDAPEAARRISLHADHADPWAFSDSCFLCVRHEKIVVMDGEGREVPIFALEPEGPDAGFWCADVQPVIPRQREEILADTTDFTQKTGRIAMANIYEGRQMKDVPRGTVKELLILEPLPIPVHYNGGMMSISAGGTFAIERIVGKVPVEEDGSVYMELPARRSFLFIAMDQNDMPVKRMHSFTSLMPGETAICIGCHEHRTETPSAASRQQLMKTMARTPVKPQKVEGVPEIYDYFRDIVPLLDKYCLECHNPDKTEAGVNLCSHLRPADFVISYSTLSHFKGGMLGDNRNRPMSDFKPYEIGSSASTLLKLIDEGHVDKEGKRRVTMTPEERKIIHYWIEVGANYAGTYAADAGGLLVWGYTPAKEIQDRWDGRVRVDLNWPETKAYGEVVARRCAVCHHAGAERSKRAIPNSLTAPTGYSFNWGFDLTEPTKSRFLRAPLAREAGGLAICRNKNDQGQWVSNPPFKSTDDPDYQTMLRCIERGKKFITEEQTHFSIKPFIPNPWYVREMIRYGVLPPDYKQGTPIDPYETDRKYWEILAQ
ncbi:MAG: polysaccharide lyase family protein [Planctomycetia bacterium]|nr:polysaccharide lyase family protein [Planctomycetia bacterium]